MNEMLANQYFITRQYEMATQKLEEALAVNPTSKSIKKKIVICYIQINQIYEAFRIFSTLVEEDIFVIINTDIVADYCPCPDLIFEYENELKISDNFVQCLILGMLWLYCDLDKSIEYFELIKGECKQKINIDTILTRLIQTKQKFELEN